MRVRLVALAAALLLAGCGEETDGEPGSESGPDLDGRTFIATSIKDGGAIRHLAAGTELRLTFDDGQLGVNAGCNHMSGAYDVESGLLTVDAMSTTEMGCEPRLMTQDVWVSELFTKKVDVELAGDILRLHSGDVEMVLTDRVVVSPDAELEGTTWVLDALISDDAVSSVPAGVVATLIIEDGRAHIDQGCNAATADVAIEGAAITFTNATETDMGCGGDRGRVEEIVGATLFHGPVTWTITEKSLTIMGATQGLGFRVA